MLKRYYSLDEAVEFISATIGGSFQKRDLFDLAKRDELRLCVYVSGHQVTIGDPCGGLICLIEGHFALEHLDAYIELEPGQVDRNASLPLSVHSVFNVREYLERPARCMQTTDGRLVEASPECYSEELGTPCCWWFCDAPPGLDVSRKRETPPFIDSELVVEEHHLVVPAEDLLRLRRSTAPDQPVVSNPDLSGKERTRAMKLIGGLFLTGLGLDIHAARLDGIGQAADDLAEVGVSIDEKTLRKYIKEAAALIDPVGRK